MVRNEEDLLRRIEDLFRRAKGPTVSGIIFLTPLAIVILITFWILGAVSTIPGTSFLELTSYFYVNQVIKLVTLLCTAFMLVTGVGGFMRTRQGTWTEKKIDSFVTKLPLVGTVYSTAKTTADAALGKSKFGQPVKVDFGGMKITGFETGNGNSDGQNLVFLPTSPNITSGFLVEIDDEWVQRTGETRAEAMTRVLSAGFGTRIYHQEIKDKTDKESGIVRK